MRPCCEMVQDAGAWKTTHNSNSAFIVVGQAAKIRFASWGLPSLGSPQQNAMYVLAWSKTRFANKVFKLEVKGLRLQIIIPGVKIPSQALQKTQNMRLPFWESFPDPQNGGHRFASFIFTITTAPTPILGVGNRLPNGSYFWIVFASLHLFMDCRGWKRKNMGQHSNLKPNHVPFQSF